MFRPEFGLPPEIEKQAVTTENYSNTNDSEQKEQLARMPSFIESLSQALAKTDQRYRERLPQNYLSVQEKLIKAEIIKDRERLTVFHGGPLKWDQEQIDDAWLIPLEYAFLNENNELIELNFHLLAIGCQRGEELAGVPTIINLATEDELKLQSASDERGDFLIACKQRGRPQVILRPSINGSLAFPKVSTSLDLNTPAMTPELISGAMELITDHFQLKRPDSDYLARGKEFLDKQKFHQERETEDFKFSQEKILATEDGPVFVTEVICQEKNTTAWKSYKLYSCQSLAEIEKTEQINLRIDSGCEIGMNYHDGGCDCHQQLLSALKVMRTNGGVIVHLAPQDGRGYGLNTKMQTEGMKWGIDVITKKPIEKMKTTDAAKQLLGENYDIRSYRTAAIILQELGFEKFRAWTDNQKKLQALRKILGEDNITQVFTDSISKAIKGKADPQGIAQMILKLAVDHKYSGLKDEAIDAFLRYAQIDFQAEESSSKKLDKIIVFLGQK